MSFFGELRRRNVVKVAVAYAIVGWLLIEVASVLLPTFQAPEWVMRVFSFFIIAGFPVALILSWAYELTPEGIKLERNVAAGESLTKVTGRKLDFAIIGALVLALGFVAVDQYVLEDAEVSTGLLPNSVAVLPFRNDSPDPDNAYYASGIHEEILNHLVKLSALNVIARTSVEPYADTDKSIPQIASELNVETVMEGSVRYAGGQIRITTQLNDGVTGAHLWSETYTRDFDDIFAIESDVAMNVANAVGAEFSLEEQASIEQIPTVSPEAYTLYLRFVSTNEDETDLDRAIELDPEFALAYATKAWWHSSALSLSVDLDTAESETVVLENAERALALDPSLGLAHLALANLHEVYWRWAEAREAYELAYQLNPNDVTLLTFYGRFKRSSGDNADAIRVGARTVELDPINAAATHQLGVSYRYARDYEAATQTFRRVIALAPTFIGAYTLLGIVEAKRGNFDEAIRNLRIAEELSGENVDQVFRYPQLALGYAMAGRREDAERLVEVLEERSERSPVGEAVWALAYIALDDYDQALQRLEAAMAAPSSASYTTLAEIKANPWGNPVLDEPRFKEVLADLWPE